MSAVALPCYIYNAESYRRYKRWITYMDKYVQPRLKYNKIILLDNNSDPKFLKKLECTIMNESGEVTYDEGCSDLVAIQFNEQFHRRVPVRHSDNHYPWYWRSVYHLPKIKTDKVYYIDSDVYLLTTEFIEHMKNQNTGLIRYWCSIKNWPESIIMTINADAMHLLQEDSKKGIMNRSDLAEETIPYTYIDKEYFGGRFPEAGMDTPDSAHWTGQIGRKDKVKFHG